MTEEQPFRVRFLDLRITDDGERADYLSAIETVMRHGRFIQGPEVSEFENSIAKYCGRQFAIGVGSGTDAIILALKALNIGPGDEVITSSISWLASGTTIAQTGATPIFADVGDDLNINPDMIEGLISDRTKAIMPVHYAGKICDMAALRSFVMKKDIRLIEDASQSFGARRAGHPAGSESDVAVFSLNPMKLLPAIGEAGVILCDDPAIDQEIRSRRYHGMIDRWQTDKLSPNARLDTVQAAILIQRLDKIDAIIARRSEIADRYQRALSNYVAVPRESKQPGTRNAWFVYAIQTLRRDALLAYLRENGVEAMIRDHIVLPDQPIFAGQHSEPIENARRMADGLICLPLHESLSNDDADFVIRSVISFFDGEHV